MRLIGLVDFAAAVTRTGEATVLPAAGVQMFTPDVLGAVHEALPTVNDIFLFTFVPAVSIPNTLML